MTTDCRPDYMDSSVTNMIKNTRLLDTRVYGVQTSK